MGRRSRANQDSSRVCEQEVAAEGIACDGKALARTRWTVVAICISLLLGIAIIFGQTANHPFIQYDDPEYIYENPEVVGGLTVHGIAWAFTAMHADNWHPLTWISHQLDWQIYGDWAGGHHLTSAAMHAATAILLFLVLRSMTGQLGPSALVAALFALHPLRVESVAWAAERKDVLSGLFFVLTLGAYARYVKLKMRGAWGVGRGAGSGERGAWGGGRGAWVVVLFALGLMAKPMLVTLPLVLLLLDYWPLRRFSSTRAWILVVEKIPLLVLSLASCVVTLIVQVKPMEAMMNLPLPWRLANAVVAYVAYLGQLFYPVNLALLYPHPGDELPIWKILASLLTLLAVSMGVVLYRRKHPYLIVGWFWYLVMLLPVIGLAQVGGQAMADRYTYLPQIGIALALTWGADELRRSWLWRPKMVGIALALLLLVLTTMACLQTSYWQDGVTVWRHTLSCKADNPGAHEGLAVALIKLGQTEEALAEFAEYQVVLRTLGIDPGASFYYNRGVALDLAGQTQESIACFEKSLRVQPDYPRAHFNLANLLVGEGKRGEAIGHFDEAIRQKPDYFKAHCNLAWVLATTNPQSGGDPCRAVALAQRACQLAGEDSPLGLDVLAAAYAAAGRFPEAVATAQKGVHAASLAGETILAQQIEARLKLYRQNRK